MKETVAVAAATEEVLPERIQEVLGELVGAAKDSATGPDERRVLSDEGRNRNPMQVGSVGRGQTTSILDRREPAE